MTSSLSAQTNRMKALNVFRSMVAALGPSKSLSAASRMFISHMLALTKEQIVPTTLAGPGQSHSDSLFSTAIMLEEKVETAEICEALATG